MGKNRSSLKDDWFIKHKEHPGTPSRNLFDRYYHERGLRSFFSRLSAHGIKDLEDISQYTEAEVLEISPLNWFGRQTFRHYVKNGQIELKP